MNLLALVLAAAACAECHRREHDEWVGSRHASAATNSLFGASFALHGYRGWCLTCHAPLPGEKKATRSGWTLTDAAAEGVSCEACHLRGGSVLSSKEPTAAGLKAHAIEKDATLGSSACARCHNFNVPKEFGDPTQPMQSTYDEWLASPAAAEGKLCVTCHDHRGRGGHDADRLRHALHLEVHRASGVLTARVWAEGVGHALPTGDPFRRLLLTLGDVTKRIVVPAGTALELTLPATKATQWQLTWLLAEPELTAPEHTVLVSEGTVVED